MERCEVAVVGAGPAGSKVAELLALCGVDTIILEEHATIGRPIQCAGLISPETLRMAGNNVDLINEIRGGDIFSPGGKVLHLLSDETKAVVIQRDDFDRVLFERALGSGARAKLGSKVISAIPHEKGYLLEYLHMGKKKLLSSQYLVGADGSGSAVRKFMGFSSPRETLFGYGSVGRGATLPLDEVVIFLGGDIAPGFFAWIIPEDTQRTRVGLCVEVSDDGRNTPFRCYNKLLAHPLAKKYLSNYLEEETLAGKIDLGLLSTCIKGRCALIGDSAAMAKPLSGGGIYPALLGAPVLAEAICCSIKANKTQTQSWTEPLQNYQDFIDKEMRPDNERGMLARKIYGRLVPETMERAFEILDEKRVLRYMEKHGNIDRPFEKASGVILRAPKLIALGISGLTSIMG